MSKDRETALADITSALILNEEQLRTILDDFAEAERKKERTRIKDAIDEFWPNHSELYDSVMEVIEGR